MALNDILVKQVKNIMGTMRKGNLAVATAYYSYTGQVYNPATRTNSPSYAAVQNIYAIFTKMDEEEGIPTEKTSKVLIASADLTVVPKEQDKILALGQVWFVDRIMGVPGDSLYILKVCRDSA